MKVAPRGATLITWPADLKTANISAHTSQQPKLVRSVEQTKIDRPSQVRYILKSFTLIFHYIMTQKR